MAVGRLRNPPGPLLLFFFNRNKTNPAEIHRMLINDSVRTHSTLEQLIIAMQLIFPAPTSMRPHAAIEPLESPISASNE
jgi:hypothetical protein